MREKVLQRQRLDDRKVVTCLLLMFVQLNNQRNLPLQMCSRTGCDVDHDNIFVTILCCTFQKRSHLFRKLPCWDEN